MFIYYKEGELGIRTCCHCQCEIIEGFDVKIVGLAFDIVITKGTGIFAKKVGKPKIAICPKCGEVSFYIDNVNKILECK